MRATIGSRTGGSAARQRPELGAARRPRMVSRSLLLDVALILFVIAVTLGVNAVKLGAGPLPLRSVALLGAAVFIALGAPHMLRRALSDCWRALAVLALAAALGVAISLIARADMGAVVQQLVEIHLQAAIGLIVSYVLCLHFGPKPVLITFLVALGISSIFAIGQALGIDAAWQARAFIGRISGDSVATQYTYTSRYRALGLGFTPVLFATQTCLGVVAFYALRYVKQARNLAAGRPVPRIDLVMLAGCAIFGLLAATTGNRSPLLGLVIFGAIYLFLRMPKLIVVLLPLALLMPIAIQPLMRSLDDAGVRVASTDDGSAIGRETLQHYGMLLVKARPYGYGLTFDSTRYAEQFFSELRYDDGPERVRAWALHNYYIVILGKYGLGIIFVVLLALPTTRRGWYLALGFLPYIAHIFFHNDGPLQGDFLIFYVLGAVIFIVNAGNRSDRARLLSDRRGTRAWRRAFDSAPPPTQGTAGMMTGRPA